MAHSFPRPRNFEPSAELSLCPGILTFPRNFAQVENSVAISMIFDLMTYFYHEKNQTNLPKAVGPTNSYHNMAQS